MNPPHNVWAPSSSDPTELQSTIYKLLLSLLTEVENRLEGTLTTPASVGGKKIMDACLADAALSSMNRVLRPHVLDDLQRRIRSFTPDLKTRIFLPPAPRSSAISRNFGDQIVALERAKAQIENWIRENGPVGANPNAATTDPDITVGAFLVLLITRSGICWPRQVGVIIDRLDVPMRVAGTWCYLNVTMPDSPGTPGQNRRVFADPVVAAAYAQAQIASKQWSTDKVPQKASKRPLYFTKVADRCVRKVCAAASVNEPLISTLKNLCAAQEQVLRLNTLPLVATYAAGRLASSSISEESWLAMLGYMPPDNASDHEKHSKPRRIETGLSMRLDRSNGGAAPDLQIEAGDRSDDGLSADLRRITSLPRSEWHPSFSKLLNHPDFQGETNTGRMVILWMDHLAHERQSKGKKLAEGTISYKRGLAVHRLLTTMPPDLAGLTAEEFVDAYLEIANSGASSAHSGRIIAALGDFHRFACGVATCLPKLGGLSGFGGDSYAISSHIITEGEYEDALLSLGDGRIAISEDTLRNQVRLVLILAFRLGLRRNEILGLSHTDYQADCFLIRNNDARSLKSRNSQRKAPLSLLNERELEVVRVVFSSNAPFPFFPDVLCPSQQDLDNHPVIPLVNKALLRATPGRKVHPHNLRHSAASLAVFGMLANDVGFAHFPTKPSWMVDAAKRGELLTSTLTSPFKRQAVSFPVKHTVEK